jgi:YbgC/YbaW family acyl-CoA thioester hydrolase
MQLLALAPGADIGCPAMKLQFPFSIEFPVRGYEIDSWGHVNNAVYLQWLEYCRWEMAAAEGGFTSFAGDVLPVLRHVELDYRAETLLGDHVRVSVWPRSLGQTSFTLGFAVRVTQSREAARVGTLNLVSKIVFACIRRGEGKVPVPDGWRQYFPGQDPGEALPAGV